jgi:membrane protein implicated in regulation of membrane protease activity
MSAQPHQHDREPRTRPRVSVAMVLAWVCLAVPFVALLWVGSYAKTAPEVAGFPFFFWYQLLWVFIAAALTSVAYRVYRRRDARRRAAKGVRADVPQAEAGGEEDGRR